MAKRTHEELAEAVRIYKTRDDFTYKTDINKRMTNEEIEIFDAAIESAPARERRMWTDSQTVEHADDYFAQLKEQMAAAFGEDRAAELLAPSQGGN